MDPGAGERYSASMRLRIPIVLASIALAAGVRHAATIALINLDELRADFIFWSPGWSSYFAADRLATAAVGVVAAIAIATALVRGHRLRWLGAIACAVSLIELAIAVFDHGHAFTLA